MYEHCDIIGWTPIYRIQNVIFIKFKEPLNIRAVVQLLITAFLSLITNEKLHRCCVKTDLRFWHWLEVLLNIPCKFKSLKRWNISYRILNSNSNYKLKWRRNRQRSSNFRSNLMLYRCFYSELAECFVFHSDVRITMRDMTGVYYYYSN